MKITQHGELTYKLTQYGLMNGYFVVDGDSLILVDALLPNAAKGILKAANEIGKPIRKIVVTHAHLDHVGSVDKIAEALGGIELFASAQSAKYMRNEFTEHDTGTGNFPKLTTPVTQEVDSGDQVGPLVVIQSPGHTRGHISWFDGREDTLFAGDSWQTVGGLAVMGDTRWLFPLPSLASWDRRVSFESGPTSLELEPYRLCVGHGPVIEDAYHAMKAAYDRAKKKFKSFSNEEK